MIEFDDNPQNSDSETMGQLMQITDHHYPTTTYGKAGIMPVASVTDMQARYYAIQDFIKAQLVEGMDYGNIPGCGDKPVLLLPGAQKVASFFGLYPSFTMEKEVFDVPNRFFFFRYKCRLYRDGELRGEGIGNINSWETKYGFRWVEAHELPPGIDTSTLEKKEASIGEFQFAIDKAETSGKYGKPIAYWQAFRKAIAENKAVRHERPTKSGLAAHWEIKSTKYRIPNPAIFDELNTLEKMACKRAYVAAVLMATGTAQFFTQDLEERESPVTPPSPPQPISEPEPVPTPAQSEEDQTLRNKGIVERILFFKDMFTQLGHEMPPKPAYVIGNTPKDFVTETIERYLKEIKTAFAELFSNMLYDASQEIPSVKPIAMATVETMKMRQIKEAVLAFNHAVSEYNGDAVTF